MRRRSDEAIEVGVTEDSLERREEIEEENGEGRRDKKEEGKERRETKESAPAPLIYTRL